MIDESESLPEVVQGMLWRKRTRLRDERRAWKTKRTLKRKHLRRKKEKEQQEKKLR